MQTSKEIEIRIKNLQKVLKSKLATAVQKIEADLTIGILYRVLGRHASYKKEVY